MVFQETNDVYCFVNSILEARKSARRSTAQTGQVATSVPSELGRGYAESANDHRGRGARRGGCSRRASTEAQAQGEGDLCGRARAASAYDHQECCLYGSAASSAAASAYWLRYHYLCVLVEASTTDSSGSYI